MDQYHYGGESEYQMEENICSDAVSMYRLGHSKSDLTDIDTRGKIMSPRRG